jgi:hypothetical protein
MPIENGIGYGEYTGVKIECGPTVHPRDEIGKSPPVHRRDEWRKHATC